MSLQRQSHDDEFNPPSVDCYDEFNPPSVDCFIGSQDLSP